MSFQEGFNIFSRTWKEWMREDWLNNKHVYHYWRKFFFLFIDWKPTTWPANNCLQIMVCSCAMLSYCVWLQIILFCSWNHIFLPLVITLPWEMADPLASQRSNDKTYWTRLSQNIVICQCLSRRSTIIDPLPTDKISQYVAQLHLIIGN